MHLREGNADWQVRRRPEQATAELNPAARNRKLLARFSCLSPAIIIPFWEKIETSFVNFELVSVVFELGGAALMRVLILKSAVFPSGSMRFLPADLPVSIGRSRRADIVIEDRLMSRLHAEFRLTAAGEFELADLESTNLAIVNEHEVEEVVLKTGDCILLGETELFVEVGDDGSGSLHDRTTREIPASGKSE